ncbi:MAG: hypothetical protein AB7S50_14220 [Bacteroidales bacterium]
MADSHLTGVIFFTCDEVLTQILNRLLEKCIPNNLLFTVYDSFSDASSLNSSDCCKIILVDDSIIGTSSFELISYIRLNKKISSPIIYFGIDEHGNETKAISIGANYFISKPFNPDDVVNLLNYILEL